MGHAARRQRPDADRARPAGRRSCSASAGSAARRGRLRAARFVDWGLLRRGPQPLFLTIVEVRVRRRRARALLPAADDLRARRGAGAVEERRRARDPRQRHRRAEGRAVRRLARRPLRADAARGAREAGADHDPARRRCSALQTATFAALRGRRRPARPRRMSTEQSNTSLVFGDRLILKLFRRLETGINPDFEIGRHLTETVRLSRACRRWPAPSSTRRRRRSSRPRSPWCSSWSRARPTAGVTRPTKLSRFYDRHREPAGLPTTPPARTFTELTPAVAPAVSPGRDRRLPRNRRDARQAHRGNAPRAGQQCRAIRRSRRSRSRKDDLHALTIDATAQARNALDALKARGGTAPRWRLAGWRSGRSAAARARAAAASNASAPSPALEFTVVEDPRPRRLSPRPGALGRGGFLHPRLRGGTGQAARASPRKSSRRSRTSPACCDRSATRRTPRCSRTGAARPAAFAHDQAWARVWQTWTCGAFLRGYFSTVGQRALHPDRAVAARRPAAAVRARQGALRVELRAQQPAGLAAHSAERHARDRGSRLTHA